MCVSGQALLEDIGWINQPLESILRIKSLKWSNKQIAKAGKLLANSSVLDAEQNPDELLILSDWRAAHELPLSRVQALLRRRITSLGWRGAVVSGRTKRLPSIVAKLIRESDMTLATMQDIGGCRAVVDDIHQVEALSALLQGNLANTFSRGGQIRGKNYIENPKSDGYRSVHLVVRYQPQEQTDPPMRILRTEIQIRSALQHRWATAVETVDLFTGQNLKAGGGELPWRRFFALTASIFAIKEDRPVVPETSGDLAKLEDEQESLANALHVRDRLTNWAGVMKDISDSTVRRDQNSHYLVEVDVANKTTNVWCFDEDMLLEAHKSYRMAEQANASIPTRSAILVSTHSLAEVREAYPAYHGDTRAFLMDAGLAKWSV